MPCRQCFVIESPCRAGSCFAIVSLCRVGLCFVFESPVCIGLCLGISKPRVSEHGTSLPRISKPLMSYISKPSMSYMTRRADFCRRVTLYTREIRRGGLKGHKIGAKTICTFGVFFRDVPNIYVFVWTHVVSPATSDHAKADGSDGRESYRTEKKCRLVQGGRNILENCMSQEMLKFQLYTVAPSQCTMPDQIRGVQQRKLADF